MSKDKKLIWNGNEFVFSDNLNKGVMGLAPDVDESVGKEIEKRYNSYTIMKDALIESTSLLEELMRIIVDKDAIYAIQEQIEMNKYSALKTLNPNETI